MEDLDLFGSEPIETDESYLFISEVHQEPFEAVQEPETNQIIYYEPVPEPENTNTVGQDYSFSSEPAGDYIYTYTTTSEQSEEQPRQARQYDETERGTESTTDNGTDDTNSEDEKEILKDILNEIRGLKEQTEEAQETEEETIETTKVEESTETTTSEISIIISDIKSQTEKIETIARNQIIATQAISLGIFIIVGFLVIKAFIGKING